jgi:hypothetical protein
MDFTEVGLDDMDWTVLAPGRDKWRDPVNMIMNPLVTHIVGMIHSGSAGVSRRAQLHGVSTGTDFCYTKFAIPLTSIIYPLYSHVFG